MSKTDAVFIGFLGMVAGILIVIFTLSIYQAGWEDALRWVHNNPEVDICKNISCKER